MRFRLCVLALLLPVCLPAAAFRPEPGDQAEYDLYLFGMRIGRQTVAVTACTQTPAGFGYRVVAETTTARWVSRIYRLRDVVTTTILYERHVPVSSFLDIREGRYTNAVWVDYGPSSNAMCYRDSRGKKRKREHLGTLLDAVSLIFHFAAERPETAGKMYLLQVVEGDKVEDRKVRFAGRDLDPKKGDPPAVVFEEIGGREIKVWYPANPAKGRYFPIRMVLARIKLGDYPITSLRAEIVPP